MNCKICSSNSDYFANGKILCKYEIKYFKCRNCGFIQTEDPYWLNEAYTEAINKSDVGLVGRNLFLSNISKAVICAFFKVDEKFIDYGGGYGLYVRLMRDQGFDFYHYDKHCKNLFAVDFEAGKNNQYELLTAFEVFEHLVNPIDELEKMNLFSKNMLFTTELIPSRIPNPDEWWYYGLDHGQHVSFYTEKSLSIIAKKLSLNLYSNGKSFHLLTSLEIPSLLFKVLSRHKAANLFNKFFNKKSLIPYDYKKITGKKLC